MMLNAFLVYILFPQGNFDLHVSRDVETTTAGLTDPKRNSQWSVDIRQDLHTTGYFKVDCWPHPQVVNKDSTAELLSCMQLRPH
jgi:hypothetical protein